MIISYVGDSNVTDFSGQKSQCFGSWYSVTSFSSNFRCGIDPSIMVECDFSSIMVMFVRYLDITMIENVNIASKAIVGENGSPLCMWLFQI